MRQVVVACSVATMVAALSGCANNNSAAPTTPMKKPPEATVSPGFTGRPMTPPPKRIDAARAETRDDIVAIHSFWQQAPWLFPEIGERTPVGFQAPVYFVSGQTEKGAFVPGEIICRIYVVQRQPDGTTSREQACEWTLDAASAMGFRSLKQSIMGNHYGFILRWPAELNLAGRLIELEFGYRRLNGSVVTGVPKRFRVPMPNEPLPPPTHVTTQTRVARGAEAPASDAPQPPAPKERR